MRGYIILALIAASAVLAGCGKHETAPVQAAAENPVTASVWTVAEERFQSSVAVTGSLTSTDRVEVKAEVIGRVVRFDKEEGSPVMAGEPVAWVDDENYRLSVQQAETAVTVAESGLSRAVLVEAHSRAELQRAENLLKSGGITERDLKSAKLAERDAAAQVGIAKAQLAQAEAARDVARKHLRDTVIRAPITGEIQRKAVNKGAYVEAPTAVMTIVDNSRLELDCPVPAADLASLRPGQAASFRVNTYPGETFRGSVINVNPAVDELTRSAMIRIRVDNAARKLKAGMFAEGAVLTGMDRSAILAPSAAVYRDDRSAKSAHVFVVVGGKAARREVRIGGERDSKLEIAEGLQAGDRLIVEQSIEIADGVQIQPRS